MSFKEPRRKKLSFPYILLEKNYLNRVDIYNLCEKFLTEMDI